MPTLFCTAYGKSDLVGTLYHIESNTFVVAIDTPGNGMLAPLLGSENATG
jgi:hypothetical protein